MSRQRRSRPLFVCAALFACAVLPTHAATLGFQLSSSGLPVADAVVYLTSTQTGRMAVQAPLAQIDQIDKEFVPLVSVVQTGTQISFPNKDNIRHQVYSFSKPKKFEIKLYADTPSKPVTFDQPGHVVMGCNIHDNMIAHLLVVDTPYFAKTDTRGFAQIVGVPDGDYSLTAWYYQRPDQNALLVPLKVKGDKTHSFSIKTRSAE